MGGNGEAKMAEDRLILAYVTTASHDEALRLGAALVEERLAACVNVFPGMTSIYRWEGQVQQSGEASLLLKTRADLVPALTARVRELHRYTLPCVVTWPIADGNPAFLDWIRDETRDA
jgi:periplasmic divalent cation tolerance protein